METKVKTEAKKGGLKVKCEGLRYRLYLGFFISSLNSYWPRKTRQPVSGRRAQPGHADRCKAEGEVYKYSFFEIFLFPSFPNRISKNVDQFHRE